MKTGWLAFGLSALGPARVVCTCPLYTVCTRDLLQSFHSSVLDHNLLMRDILKESFVLLKRDGRVQISARGNDLGDTKRLNGVERFLCHGSQRADSSE